jgi:hypothetical protein
MRTYVTCKHIRAKGCGCQAIRLTLKRSYAQLMGD